MRHKSIRSVCKKEQEECTKIEVNKTTLKDVMCYSHQKFLGNHGNQDGNTKQWYKLQSGLLLGDGSLTSTFEGKLFVKARDQECYGREVLMFEGGSRESETRPKNRTEALNRCYLSCFFALQSTDGGNRWPEFFDIKECGGSGCTGKGPAGFAVYRLDRSTDWSFGRCYCETGLSDKKNCPTNSGQASY